MVYFLQLVFSGLATGAVYGLVALGFVLIFKSTDVFNFAQGNLIVVGAYTTFTMMTTFALPIVPALLATIVASVIIGIAIQQIVIRPMLGQPLLSIIMATIALSLVLNGLILIIFGPTEYMLPSRLPEGVVQFFGVRLAILDILVMAIALCCVVIFAIFFQRSSLGLQMRAMAENQEAAVLSGINSNRIFAIAFAIGTVTAAIGGVLLANLQSVSAHLAGIGLLAAPAAVIGGLRSIYGAVVGGLIIGVLQLLTTGYLSSDASNVIVYVALLLMLLVRPFGLFGKPEVARV